MSLDINKIFNNDSEMWDVSISGDVDITSSLDLKENLNSILDKENKSIRINCENLSYIDSTGLGVLISILKRVKSSGNDIEILDAKPNISKLFKITGLDKIFIVK